ncbi:MAG TPA: hypothetical protein PK733_00175 [Clostridiales bacterium]|nr:hypothetical protein [Clostridiales bacterium]
MSKKHKLIRNTGILLTLLFIHFMFSSASLTALSAHKKSEKTANYGPSKVIQTQNFKYGKLFLCKYDKWFSCNTVKKGCLGMWYPGNQVHGKENDVSRSIDYYWHGSTYRDDYMLWMLYGVVNDNRIISVKMEAELHGEKKILEYPQLYDNMFLFTWNSKETDYKIKRLIGFDKNLNAIYEVEMGAYFKSEEIFTRS